MSGGSDPFYIGVYVDDMILAGKNKAKIDSIKRELSSRIDIKDLGKLIHFLGVSVVQNDQGTWMGQPAYTERLLEKMKMSDCKPVQTPLNSGSQLVKTADNEEPLNQHLYQSLIGSLMYLATSTRPDIAYSVGVLARFSSRPNAAHWTAAKRVLRYLKGTLNLGIVFKKEMSIDCIGYSDADWAGDNGDRKSTSGYLFLIAGGPVSWRSKKQDTVALSTAEAEYVALSIVSQECVWLRRLNSELKNEPQGPTTILEDNQSCIAMAKNPQFHGRTKHVNIKQHYIREQVHSKTVELKYCPTQDMVADMLTKGLPPVTFNKLREKAGMLTLTDFKMSVCEEEC